jgi:hypothetical protein
MIREAINGNVFAAKFITERVEGLPRQEVDVRSHNITETITSNMSVQRATEIYMDFIKSDEVIDVDLSPGDYQTVDTLDQVKADQARALQKVLAKPTTSQPTVRGTPRKRRSRLLEHADTSVGTKASERIRRKKGSLSRGNSDV